MLITNTKFVYKYDYISYFKIRYYILLTIQLNPAMMYTVKKEENARERQPLFERVLKRESRERNEPSGSTEHQNRCSAVTTAESVADKEPKELLTSQTRFVCTDARNRPQTTFH
ncbi:hypothetical protein A2592_01525 [Candidatus Kaiserbacteria bacterium RIFOXYD1_FULL_42_15]|uniref:Uncharacterized protein n=1 Tax=Candidatus Kaiserbacteria bacterium RIFOXYD1_FULL_42_15 TaxID=1798532 RepID=A0A1F6FQ16_9BACT|nr:MAG: hypothetical protein A2592_01525 [Candidatus Kaiserbacteria bacterium RIFOXYD1_FULL_42_15]